jgi:uncharacterized protein
LNSHPQRSYEVPTWHRLYLMLLKQTEKICKSGFTPDIIVGISRGGWVPARVLSDLLENPNLANVKAECYVGIGQTMGKPKLTQCLSTDVFGKKVLIVDEVADSGRSLKLVSNHVLEQGANEIKTATLYCKPCSAFKPNYFEKETDSWVVFPWEIKETIRAIYEESKNEPEKIKKEFAKISVAGVPKRLISRFLNEFSEAKTC